MIRSTEGNPVTASQFVDDFHDAFEDFLGAQVANAARLGLTQEVAVSALTEAKTLKSLVAAFANTESPSVEVGAVGSAPDVVVVSADGACRGNPGPAGWGWVRQDGLWRSGHIKHGTNQVAELLALLDALTWHAEVPDLTIQSDSAYAIGTYESWMDSAAKRGWKNSKGEPTSNREIIARMMAARDQRRADGLPDAKLVKVKGHSGHLGNEWADNRAVAASHNRVKDATRTLPDGSWVGEGLDISALPPAGEGDTAYSRR